MTTARRLVIGDDVDAIEQSARAIAATAGHAKYGTVQMLASVLRGKDEVALWIRSALPTEHLSNLESEVSVPLGHRRPVDTVHADDGVGVVYDTASDIASQAGRQVVSNYDLALALALVPGPHTQFLIEHEARLLRALRRNPDAPPRPRAARNSTHSFLDGLAVILRGGSAGAVLVFFGAGLILRRGLAHSFALFKGSRIRFPSIWNSDEHSMYSDRAMSFRSYIGYTLLIRGVLLGVSISILFRIMLEMRGLGFVPWPALTSGARELDSGDLETSIGAEVIFGGYALQIWIAAGAAFFGLPSAVEVGRVRQWATISRKHRAIRVVLGPLEWLSRIASRFDGTTVWLGAPVAIASGALACIGAVLFALVLVRLTLAIYL